MNKQAPKSAITRRAAMGGALALPALAASAQDAWPSRPVRIIVPYSPGGGTDVTTRAIAEQLTTKFGRSFVVENRAGANGIVGTEAVARSAPDGYTFGAQTSTHIMARQMGPLPYDPVTDFTLISITARYPLVLMASARAPFDDIPSMLAAARRTNGGLPQGTSDAQSSFAAALFSRRTGIDFNEVPYRGSGAYLADLTGGHLPVAWGSPATAAAIVASGAVKLLAVTSPTRSRHLPNVPTLREAGVDAEFVGWFALLAPANLPPTIGIPLNAAINEIIATPAMQARYATLGNDFTPMDLEQLQALMRSDDERWAQATRDGLIRRTQ